MDNDYKFSKVADENGINIEFECTGLEDFINFFNNIYEDLLKDSSSENATIKFHLHGDNSLKELYMKKEMMPGEEGEVGSDKSIILSDNEIDDLVDELI
ncbi:MAG: hypothetical protein J6C31_05345 [Prevotella sp.]|nr:hypothetical protein [Prevotella sp.]